jgi:two-component system, OmpR family, sensor histidine kinase PhoQ
MFTHSLSKRLLIAVSILLLLFFGITIAVLDTVFRDASEQAIRERLEIQSLVLMAASDEHSGDHLVPDNQQLDNRFLQPNSGLYGQIANSRGAFWRSPSLLDEQLPIAVIKPGVHRFGLQALPNGTQVLTLSVGLSWEFANRRAQNMVFSVAENRAPYYRQLQHFRLRLFGGFAVMSLLLLIALALLFRNVLQPLRRIEREISDIEAGRLAELSGGYPRELSGVTTNLNALLRSERERMDRYRNTLGNLAHSLKTPLAVIRNLLSTGELRQLAAARQLDEQVERMDDIVRYQLKRAAASAGLSLGAAPVPLRAVIEPLVATLQKVYFERRVACEIELPPDLVFMGDKDDLLELTGNLLDNAFKYGHGQVKVSAARLIAPPANHAGIVLSVEDDGPGIATNKRQQVLERGARLDERISGQGIGLSVVRELAELYRGSVEIDTATLGGARVTVRLLP